MSPVRLANNASLPYIAPELVLVLGMALVILADLRARRRPELLVGVALATLGGSLATALALAERGVEPETFGGLLVFDRFANAFRVLFAIASASIAVIAAASSRAAARDRSLGELLALILALTVGMNLMAESRHLLLVYLSLELVSVVSFVLAGLGVGDRRSSEGALKYVVFGGVASGIMLYGMSFLFGFSGSLEVAEIAARTHAATEAGRSTGHLPAAAFLGAACVLAGFAYKISAAPFHMWTPDVYEGAPTVVTALLSVGPKAAGFALLARFFMTFSQGDEPLATRPGLWPVIGGCLAIGTMFVGNLSALGQTNVKRMLAYSSIAHAGYMLLGFSAFSAKGTASILFYAFVYCLMNLGAFLVVIAVASGASAARPGSGESIDAFRGLGRRSPLLAAAMALFLFSLAGLPPFSGFVGKVYLFAALLEAGCAWSYVLALAGIVNSVIALVYYARVVRAMYLEASELGEATEVGPEVPRVIGALTAALAIPTLLLGLYWGPLYDFVAGSVTFAP